VRIGTFAGQVPYQVQLVVDEVSGSCEFCGRPLDSVTKISVRCAMTVAAALRDFVSRHPAGSYFILTFAVSWGGFFLIGGRGFFAGTSWHARKPHRQLHLRFRAGPSLHIRDSVLDHVPRFHWPVVAGRRGGHPGLPRRAHPTPASGAARCVTSGTGRLSGGT
jgi:hypothetical protein